MMTTGFRAETSDRLREVVERSKRAIVFDVAAALLVAIGYAGSVVGFMSL